MSDETTPHESDESTTSETGLVVAQKRGPSPDSDEVRDIIRKRVYLAMGIGVVPLPFLNVFADSLVQVKLVSDLCKVYGVEYKESLVKNIISSVLGGAATLAVKPALEKAHWAFRLSACP